MSRSAFSSPPGFARPPAPEKRFRTWRVRVRVKKARQDKQSRPDGAIGLGLQDALYRRTARPDARPIPVMRKNRCGDQAMAVDGNWNSSMGTPRGDRSATLSLKNSGGKRTGTQGAD